MDDDEAALLAELKAISGSSSSRRFGTPPPAATADEEEEDDELFFTPDRSLYTQHSHQQPSSSSSEPKTPKQGKENKSNGTSAPSSRNNSKQKERGGAAEDPELLSELRAISSKTYDDEDEEHHSRTKAAADDDRRGSARDVELLAELKAISSKPEQETKPIVTDDDRRGSARDEELLAELQAISRQKEEDRPASPPLPAQQKKGGFQSSDPSTFSGDRGGSAEDAELLAELLAISSKSKSENRFSQEDEAMETKADDSFADAPPSSPPKKVNTTPPWKKKKAKPVTKPKESVPTTAKAESKDGVVVAAPPTPTAPPERSASPPLPAQQNKGGFESLGPSTFSGDRGGSAEDAELLAELLAISSKSKSENRFGHDDEPMETKADDSFADAPPSSPPKKGNTTPPWKKKKAKPVTKPKESVPKNKSTAKAESKDDVVVAAPPTSPAPPERSASPPLPAQQNKGGFESLGPSTFSGDRGGSAEDAELLAELLAVSSKSKSENRFSQDDGEGIAASPEKIEISAPASNDSSALPPWKKGKKAAPKKEKELPPWKKKAMTNTVDEKSVDVSVSKPIQRSASPPLPTARPSSPGGFGSSSSTSTFTGDRGGSAEDAELLAELRAISSGSARTNRFSAQDDDGDDTAPVEPNNVPPRKKKGKELPPWKKKAMTNAVDEESVDVSVSKPIQRSASPPLPAAKPSSPGGFGSSSSTSTFTGDRGGSAEDAELLAELRAISSGSAPTNRFSAQDDDGDDTAPAEPNYVPPRKKKVIPAVSKPAKKPSPKKPTVSQDSGTGFQSSASTFKGERGGAADDADLLAELRAISSGSRKMNEDMGNDENEPSPEKPKAQAPSTPQPLSSGDGFGASPSANPMGQAAPTDITVSRDDLPDAVKDKIWKTRKAAYELMAEILIELSKGRESSSAVDVNQIFPSCDDSVPGTVKDSNAGALDAGLEFANLYADHCTQAVSAEQAARITSSVVKGPGLSSSRPKTGKLCSSLVLKLMEVGENGASSVHSVVEVLLQHGVTSKKPKVVISTSSLILEAARGFGAAYLPLAAISSSASKMLAHANPKIRETGLDIVAEICRAVGSKTALQSVIDDMKPAQLSQLDKLLESQPNPLPPTVGLRSQRKSGSASSGAPVDALAALQEGTKELEAKRLAARPVINLITAIDTTEYSSKLKLAKWSEKVGALDLVLECGGEQPYKLVQPSNVINYNPLISDMKKLLSHTHFAVNSKALAVLAMLAEGVGEKLFPNLRPLLPVILQLLKDKKLTRATGPCLDSFFGNVLSFDHILEAEDGIPTAASEQKEKNALARIASLDYLLRCVQRRGKAGPRSEMSPSDARNVAKLGALKLEDSDAGPRKSALALLTFLTSIEDADIFDAVDPIIQDLKTKQPRAYKSLSAGASKKSAPAPATKATPRPSTSSRASDNSKVSSSQTRTPERKATAGASRRPSSKPSARSAVTKPPPVPLTQSSTKFTEEENNNDEQDANEIPSAEEAMDILTSMDIPNWDLSEEDEGVLACLQSSVWKARKGAIGDLTEFCKSEQFRSNSQSIPSSAILVVVKEHTKGFKESNFNVSKAIMELFITLCEIHEEKSQPLSSWISKSGAVLGVEKMSDKKLSSTCPLLLNALCVVRPPKAVTAVVISTVEKAKSPLVHEGVLTWFNNMCVEFGAGVLGNGIKSSITWVLNECASTNVKVRTAALGIIGELHKQLGPVFKALVLSDKASGPVKPQIESTIDANPFDPSEKSMPRNKSCIASGSSVPGSSTSGSSEGLGMEIPKTDLVASLPRDCLTNLGSKEGKTAWKIRKAAMEDISAALENCAGMISTAPASLDSLVQLQRGLRDRLSDSQGNLKPVAASLIGRILHVVDKSTQARLGRVVFANLINACANDNKKTMRDAAMGALKSGTELSELEGGGPNPLALEGVVGAFNSELKESDYKAGGLPDVFAFLNERAQFMQSIDSHTSSKSQTVEKQFAATLVGCLTSSKADTRAGAESLLKTCLEHGVIRSSSVEKGVSKLVPAQQRTVRHIVEMIQVADESDASSMKTDSSSIKTPQRRKSVIPKAASSGSLRKSRKSSAILGANDNSASRQMKSSQTRSKRTSIAQKDNREEAMAGGEENPLLGMSTSGSSKEARCSLASRQRENWPDYPAEPGSTSLNTLKKSWAPMLPSSSTSALFPPSGFRSQKDALGGCDIISSAIALSKEADDVVIINHLDLVMKWLACAICSRGDTVGMQSLLNLMIDLFGLLRDQEYQLSDVEASFLLPYVLDKASAAKGRFHESMYELLASIRKDETYPAQKYGPLVCIPVIERSGLSKARALGCNECAECVDVIGLSGIGKRGILVTAKRLSEETLAENKNACLDLIETVLVKMNGDTNKFFRVCGTAHLSAKARDLIEERWSKQGGIPHSDSDMTDTSEARMSNSSNFSRKRELRMSNVAPSSRQQRLPDTTEESENDADLPSLNLRFGEAPKKEISGSPRKGASDNSTRDGPFTFKYQDYSRRDTDIDGDMNGSFQSSSQSLFNSREQEHHKETTESSNLPSSPKTGAAASLRARLQEIRQKHRVDGSTSPEKQMLSTSALKISEQTIQGSVAPLSPPVSQLYSYSEARDGLDELLHSTIPLLQSSPEVLRGATIIKQMHAAIAPKSTVGQESEYIDLTSLRASIEDDLTNCVELFTSVLNFGFKAGTPSENVGILVDLLTATLGALMAVFRDPTLPSAVVPSTLALLIRQTGTDLLDTRLAAAPASTDDDLLADATRNHLVKAINKLAIQASITSATHTSLQALMSLQPQFLSQSGDNSEESRLNVRLSKVITKLFARVIKSEEGTGAPFSMVDMEAILCSVEDMLVACQDEDDVMIPCHDMARKLMLSILNAKKNEGGAQMLKETMIDLEIDPDESLLGELVDSCDASLNARSPRRLGRSLESQNEEDASEMLASLVSAVGKTSDGNERERALNDLRTFTESHPDLDISAHLTHLSSPFRAFILKHLDSSGRLSRNGSARTLQESEGGNTSMRMADRIKHLKSKLNATEAVVQSVIEEGADSNDSNPPASPSFDLSSDIGLSSPDNYYRAKRLSRSRLSGNADDGIGMNNSLSSIRDRLAAGRSQSSISNGTSSSSSSTGHAAALRARLEAVKQSKQLGSNQ